MRARSPRACLITNPRSGRGGIDLAPVIAVLHAHGWETSVRPKRGGGDATTLAERAVAEGFDVVVGCGGDGTLSEIVDALVGTDVALGAIPGGTANLWTREIGVAPEPAAAARQLVGAQRRRVDVGRLAIAGATTKHFLLMAGFGIDAAIMAGVDKGLKNRIGKAAVAVAALRAAPAVRVVPVRVEMDGVCWEGPVAQIVVGNTRCYGGFTAMTPAALVDDGRLDVAIIPAAGVAAAGRQVLSLLLRQRPAARGAVQDRAARVVIHTPRAIPVQCDGGAVGQRGIAPGPDGVAYVCTAVPRGLTVLVPRTDDGALFLRGPLAVTAPERAAHGHRAKGSGKRLRVVAVGVDTITAARVKDDRVVTVALDAETETGGGELGAFLGGLNAGDPIRVTGTLDKERGILRAKRVVRGDE